MTKKTRNRLFTFCILVFPFAMFFGFLLAEFAKPLPPPPPLPNPNGYDDFIKAGWGLVTNVTDYSDLNEENLRKLVSEDAGSLQLARAAFQKECRVPLDYSATSTANLDRLTNLKRLALAFAAEGRLAEMENRTNDAIKSYLDLIRLGNESARGGILIDQLVGTALEGLGTGDLQNLVPQLEAKSCRETTVSLEALDAGRQTWDEVVRQEHDWSRRTFPGIRYEIFRIINRHSTEKLFQKAGREFKKQQIKTRQLMIDFAARAYELDKGHPPASVSDLAPDYLKAIPQDPFTGMNMIHLR